MERYFMTYIDSYNPMKAIYVTKENVEQWEKKILEQLNLKQYVHLSEELNVLQNLSLHYQRDEAENVFNEFSTSISNFMAFQEALFQLMNKGEIMPVIIPKTYLSGGYDIRIKYAESSSMSTTFGERIFNIPIFVHEHFIRTPSRLNQ